MKELAFVSIVALAAVFLSYAVYVQLDLGVFLATAIGSLAYVAFSFWDNYIVGAKLVIEFEPETPDLYVSQLVAIDPQAKMAQFTYRSIRVLVRNKGRKSATGCVGYAQLVHRDKGCTMFSLEPKVVGWINIPEGNYIPPHGGFAVLGVAVSFDKTVQLTDARCDKMTGPTKLNTWANTPEVWSIGPGSRLQDAFCPGDFELKVTVFSEASSPSTRQFVLKVRDNWQSLEMV